MIRLLQGIVAYRDIGELVVLCGGVGYAVQVSPHGVTAGIGDQVTLWTRQRVREDSVDLFGFATREELAMFDAMQKITRFPARTALVVLGRLGVDGLRRVISAGDLEALTGIPGIGKKTAQQMLLEMRGQIELAALPSSPESNEGAMDDAMLAMVQLGFVEKEARVRVERARKKNPEISDIAEIVKLALQEGRQ